MDSNAEIWKEATQGAEVDFSALVLSAIRAKQEQAAEKLESVEQIPAGEKLTWHVTPEQIARINGGDRVALDEFYFENFTRIKFSALCYIRHNGYVISIASWEDFTQQLYCDLRIGAVKLRPYDKAISRAVYHSFRLAPVGGEDGIYIPFQNVEN